MPESPPSMPNITARRIEAPPTWALLERKIISLMERGAVKMSQKYAERGGAWYWYDDLDDYYERSYNWCLLYNMGGDESLVDMALKHWNATTRLFDERDGNRINCMEYPNRPNRLKHNIYNEYFSMANPGDAEWHHMGEGNMAFHDLGLGDPTISENVRRARRFAHMFTGEDPEAPNYDPVHKVFRSPCCTSQGPWSHGDVDHVKGFLLGGHPRGNPDWVPKTMGVRASIYPAVKELEPNWWENPERAAQITEIFNKLVMGCDSACNLAATGLVTNAYLYTGEDKYKKWVLDYVASWIDRIRKNDGVIPDNVGPTGKVGEQRDGQWWGGLHGWSSSESAADRLFLGLIVGAQCAHLLSGEDEYLEVLRSQIVALLERSKTEEGALVVPKSHGPDGWYSYQEFTIRGGPTHLVNLWHESMSADDYELVTRVRDGSATDWNELPQIGDRGGARCEGARFQYYDGKNPDWPAQCLRADYQLVADHLEGMQRDTRTVQEIIEENAWPPNPVIIKGLVQTTMGSPAQLYNGGILRANVRYFDSDTTRPGLPQDVAALVDELSADGIGIQLVNTSHTHTRNLIVQSGAFGEHSFTSVTSSGTALSNDDLNPNRRSRSDKSSTEETSKVDGKHFSVSLPPMTSVRLDCGLKRFANDPSYAFPWHGDTVPIE